MSILPCSQLWGVVVHTTIYITDHCPTTVATEMTSEEAFTGHKAPTSHLRISDTKRTKFESLGIATILSISTMGSLN